MRNFTAFCLLLTSSLAMTAEKAVPVRVAMVAAESIQQQVPITGTVATTRISSLSPQVDGLVAKVQVEAGDYVKKGDLLVKLDKVLAGFDEQSAAASIAEAKARWQESIRQRDELNKLAKNQYMAKTSYETAEAQVKINQAIVKRLQVSYQRDVELLRRHRITAPFAGVISEKNIEAGEWTKVGDSLLQLVDIDHLRVETDVPQHYFPRLKRNAKVSLGFDAVPNLRINAKVSRIIPVASITARTFPVHIDIDNRQRKFTPGMTARVLLYLKKNTATVSLVIPRDALIKSNQQNKVWVINQKNKQSRVQQINVKTGREIGDRIEILPGDLQPGQQVVIRGNEILKPDQLVKIIP